jgi:hypothetical protein
MTSCACRLDGLQSEEEQAEEAEKAVLAKATAYDLVEYFVYLNCAGMTLLHMCSVDCTSALVLCLIVSVPVVHVGAMSSALPLQCDATGATHARGLPGAWYW